MEQNEKKTIASQERDQIVWDARPCCAVLNRLDSRAESTLANTQIEKLYSVHLRKISISVAINLHKEVKNFLCGSFFINHHYHTTHLWPQVFQWTVFALFVPLTVNPCSSPEPSLEFNVKALNICLGNLIQKNQSLIIFITNRFVKWSFVVHLDIKHGLPSI